MNFLRRYRTFFRFLLGYPKKLSFFVAILIIAATIESIQPYFYKLFVESIQTGSYASVLNILYVYIAVRIVGMLMDTLSYAAGDLVVIPAGKDARVGAIQKIQDLDLAFHLSKSTGSLISNIRRGDNAFFSLFDSFVQLTKISVNFVVVLIFFGTTNWQVALLMFVSFAINALLARFVILNNIKKRRYFNDREDEVSGLIVDNLLNFETVKYFAKENWELNRLKKSFVGWVKGLWDYSLSFRVIDITVGTAGNIGLFLILLFCTNAAGHAKISAGEFVMILGFLSSFYPRFFEVIFSIRNMAKNYVDIDHYFALFDQDTLVKEPEKPQLIHKFTGEIDFKNISFSYPDGKRGAIKDLNLKIRGGQSIALVGKSGVGKTTLVKLLMRFYDVDSGEIMIDGINIKDMGKTYLRSFMGIVPQDPNMFNDTIAYNIGYSKTDTTQKEIVAAAKMANLHDFIETLPKKYETVVGERGVKLSGGQKQRLAIARMILSNPGIIIFDEATSQLDSESEKCIQDAFWKAAKDKTTIIIAHRLSTVVKADKIIVMENNKIKEIGSHKELFNKKDSLYRHFWNLQTAS